MTYEMDIGITIFGESALPEWNFDNIILEYKQFIESNSEFYLNLKINKYFPLSNNEIGYWSELTPPCYFMGSWNLLESTKLKIPNDVQINIVPYYHNSLTPICWTAGTWGGNWELYGKPFISQPFGYSYNQFPPWTYHAAHDMVHEWFHALDILLIELGFPEFPANHNIHDCDNMGYIIENGWSDCYKYYLSTITTQMYQAIENNNNCQKPICNYIIIT